MNISYTIIRSGFGFFGCFKSLARERDWQEKMASRSHVDMRVTSEVIERRLRPVYGQFKSSLDRKSKTNGCSSSDAA